VVERVTPEIISAMFSKYGMRFANVSDKDVVAKMLAAIYRHLSVDPFGSFKWEGKRDFFSMWHYVKGSIGSGLVPCVAYAF
jgi:hypothetical protein